jgi:lysophospholipase L1-like esterase
MGHVVLLGDSIFDNGAYVGAGPDVVAQLRAVLPAGWEATLLAVDGAVIDDVFRQLGDIPADATHVVLSVGGNDALGHVDLLDRRARNGAEVLGWFGEAAGRFGTRYRKLLERIAAAIDGSQRVAICTIYNGNLGPETQRAATAALGIFNDAITRAARERGWPVIELRDLCAEPADYANPIEPSVRGGAKIARAIAAMLTGPVDTRPQ